MDVGVVASGGVVLVLHEEATTPIGGVGLPEPDDARPPVLAVVVGPEGGIDETETAALQDAGATVVRLGPHVMRTASAGPVALALLASAQACGAEAPGPRRRLRSILRVFTGRAGAGIQVQRVIYESPPDGRGREGWGTR